MKNTAFVALGANLKKNKNLSLQENIQNALKYFPNQSIKLIEMSNWYKSEPFPKLNQPWYINAVVKIATNKSPENLLNSLHEIEDQFGRKRNKLNEARTLDLDLIDFNGIVNKENPILPHPRMHLRKFVLMPLKDIEPQWLHPCFKSKIDKLLLLYTKNQKISKL
tara:strand:+ start:1827 stop:2321 length:495 start_codon:yes stop_codon:yes gene_type:complete